jgi:translation initiation factor IF-2
MSEQDAVKVYELAKELGVPPLALVDKLKGLNINVKNHMSELAADDLTRARTALGKPAAPAAKVAKKAPTRTRKKVEAAPAPAPEPVAEQPKAAAPIIRRRLKADGVTEVLTPVSHVRPSELPPEYQQQGEGEGEPAQEYQEVEASEATEAEYVEPAPVETEVEPEAPAPAQEAPVEPAPAPAAAAAGPTTPAAQAPSHTVAAAASAPTPAPGQPVAPSAPARPASVLTTRPPAGTSAPAGATSAGPASPAPGKPGIAVPARPAAPVRKSILRIVEATPPPQRPMIKPATPTGTPKVIPRGAVGTVQDKDGFRTIKLTKENLDQMAEEEAAKKRGGGGRTLEIRPEDVRFADYRKKEMVFLPKKKKLPVGKNISKTQITKPGAGKRVVEVQDTITVADLANQLSVKASDVIRKLMAMGTMASIHQALDFDTAVLIATEYQYEVKNTAFKEAKLISSAAEDKPEDLEHRPPVVTIMGHVDHGKTTLLDSIREANVAEGEAGGITQHIGAYTVEVKPSTAEGKNGGRITFIDTPGHEAFTAMRARGANATDIVVLVVSADDGVMPQTREALAHAQAAKVPIIVAVNKIDKPGANPEKIKQGLAELNVLAEDWGGDTQFVPVSALKKTNIDKLLDAILLQAEILDLKANRGSRATGTVLEARLDKGRGPVASVIVSRGTLRVGDAIVSGKFAGKVKALTDHRGQDVVEVPPGEAAEILGFEGLPNAGEKFDATDTELDARKIAEDRVNKIRAATSGTSGKVSLDALFAKIQAGEAKELSVIVKADVFGSVEAIRDSLVKLSTEKVKVKVIQAAAGGITESDVLLATASGALIVGFNVRPETKARHVAESEHVEIRSYTIIYELLDDVKKAMEGLLEKKKVERFLGRAEVRQTFSVPKIGTVAGSSVVDGKIVRGANVRLLRDSRVIYEGKMSSLRRFKDDAKEVAQGFECGIGLENYNDLKPGDIIEAYQIDLIAPTLDSA